MRPWIIILAGLIAFGLSSCNQRESREHPTAREAGRDAYRASQDLKRDAKEAAHELHDAEEQFRKGWGEAQRENETRKSDHPRPGTTAHPKDSDNR